MHFQKLNFWLEKIIGSVKSYTGPRLKLMEQRASKIVNNCLNTNIYSYLQTSGGQSYNLNLNVVHFFQHQSYLDICGSLRQLFFYIVKYVLFH